MTPTQAKPPVTQPCTDDRCPIHARGADPARAVYYTCARQVLRAHDRADAIPLLEQQSPSEVSHAGGPHVILPFHTPSLGVGESACVVVDTSQKHASREIYSFRPRRVLVANGYQGWRVDDVLLAGTSQLAPHRKLPAELFSTHVLGGVHAFDRVDVRGSQIAGQGTLASSTAGGRCGSITGQGTLASSTAGGRRGLIEIWVTRVDDQGADVLTGAILGSATYQPRSFVVRAEPAPTAIRALVTGKAICREDVETLRLVVDDGDQWVVHDVKIDQKSQFAQSGGVPGEMFSAHALDGMRFDTIRAGSCVEILASYVGSAPEAPAFRAEFQGQQPA